MKQATIDQFLSQYARKHGCLTREDPTKWNGKMWFYVHFDDRSLVYTDYSKELGSKSQTSVDYRTEDWVCFNHLKPLNPKDDPKKEVTELDLVYQKELLRRYSRY